MKCINNIISINKLNTLLFWWSTSGSCVLVFSRWRSLCSDQPTLWLVVTDSLLTLLISVLQVSWQRRQRQTLPRESLASTVHRPSSPSGTSTDAAAANQASAVRTSCFMFRRPAETTTWNSPGRKDSVYFPGDLRKRIMTSCWIDFFNFGTKLFTDERGQRCDVFRGAETFWSPPTDHHVYVKKWTHWYYTVSDLSE